MSYNIDTPCSELAGVLRCFMMFDISNNQLGRMSVSTMASYAPVHEVEQFRRDFEEAKVVHSIFLEKDCHLLDTLLKPKKQNPNNAIANIETNLNIVQKK